MRHFLPTLLLVLACATNAGAAAIVTADSIEEAEFTYDRGEYTRAARLFTPLAEQGVASAQFYLGLMHEKGRGLKQDYRTALMWFRKAAAQGYAGPQNNIGLLYEKGRGVREDLVRALMWYHVAVAMLSGDEGKTAMKRRDYLTSHMTAAQIEQAQEMAQRCQQSHFKQCD
ncbi:MAG: tetratricopeptide repeat protein [Nitrospirota bacterium]|nr:tetratricopeptide repeat protein [Nitrospirota bacterium]MDP2383660.1 tetratricopeptide repeat protein [Nitrospirota bacterium]MDP3597705.1 tetratricopeptide repeat protein [Nitrospirota bacterium]